MSKQINKYYSFIYSVLKFLPYRFILIFLIELCIHYFVIQGFMQTLGALGFPPPPPLPLNFSYPDWTILWKNIIIKLQLQNIDVYPLLHYSTASLFKKMSHTSSGPSTSIHNSLFKFSSDNMFHSADVTLFMWLNGFCDSTKSPF